MKAKLLLLACMITMAAVANAQTQKGNWKMSTSGWMYYASDRDTRNTNFGVSAFQGVGHFFANNLAAGIGLGYSYRKSKSTLNNQHGNGISLSAQGTYYVSLRDQLKVPVELSFGYTRDWSRDSQARSHYATGRAMARTGLEYFFDPTLSLTFIGGYIFSLIDPGGNHQGQGTANLGFNIYFEGKEKL